MAGENTSSNTGASPETPPRPRSGRSAVTSRPVATMAPTSTEPTTPAYLMSVEGLIAAAQDEEHPSTHIFTTDKHGNQTVLKTRQQKHAALQESLVAARAAEAAQRSLQREADRAQKASNATQSSDKNTLHPRNAPVKGDGDVVSGNKHKTLVVKLKIPSLKRKNSSDPPSSNVAANATKGNITIAPSTKGLGGAAQPWLRDEDELGHHLILSRPDLTIPEIYRDWAQGIANTAYQTADMSAPGYRHDYVRFDKSYRGMNEAESRQYDIAWRSFEAFKQHVEPYRTWLRKNDEFKAAKPFKRRSYPDNLAAHLPKRAPPTRPTFFSDGRTPVPRVTASSGVIQTAMSGVFPSQPRAATRGWTPINAIGRLSQFQPPPSETKRTTTSSARNGGSTDTKPGPKPLRWVEPVTPATSRHRTRQTISTAQQPEGGQPGPGDDQFDTVEEFVAWMSDGPDEDDSDDGVAAVVDSEELETARALQEVHDAEGAVFLSKDPSPPRKTGRGTKRRSSAKSGGRKRKQREREPSDEEDIERPLRRRIDFDPFFAAYVRNEERKRDQDRNALATEGTPSLPTQRVDTQETSVVQENQRSWIR